MFTVFSMIFLFLGVYCEFFGEKDSVLVWGCRRVVGVR